ncbi:hypothetical protein KC19_6G044400 [Ceratodon purpureus]|uniref:Uncharacterized protein n=1 Tax=Ceratodon purpureus TaxID=3225 RepID=A0A8T0HHR9_CERPU|nr:hypothetical protein KC19_6G044400 [Ceratodon purpureus]
MASIHSVLTMLLVSALLAVASGSGPSGSLLLPPVWNLTVPDNCSRFRNKTALLPYFEVWPEDIRGVPFEFCCEYQEDYSRPYELANYRYPGDNNGVLEPLPYYDLGIVREFTYYWKYWSFWQLPVRKKAVVIRCDMTDLSRLYRHRFYKHALVAGAKTAAVLVSITLAFAFISARIHRKFDDENRFEILKEQLFSDVLHQLQLALVGCSMMEAIGHSPVHMWRSQIIFNTAVVYTYLTLFALMSSFIRHAYVRKVEHERDWLWQKVMGQVLAVFIVGAYSCLVDDPSDQSLDSFGGIMLAAIAAACIWSSGVEMVFLFKTITAIQEGSQVHPSGRYS